MSPGSQYYCQSRDRQLEFEQSLEDEEENIDAACFGGQNLFNLFPWIEAEVESFNNQDFNSLVFEKEIKSSKQIIVFRVKLSKSLDIGAKFDGTVIILEDITSLKNALAEVKTLRGLLPICSHCKKIRDDNGYWNQIEAFITDHSEAEFSHSICQECAKKYYPDMDLYG